MSSVKTQTDSDVIELERTECQEPNQCKVVFYNDDVTSINFVIFVLREVFHKNSHEAEEITMNIHTNGSGVAGVYTEEIAEMKREETIALARANNFPLRVEVEEE